MSRKDELTRVFIHGLESSARGTKGLYFKKHFPEMIVEDYGGTLDERMAHLNEVLRDRNNILMVGSSYGGLMAVIFACNHPERVRRLVLLAPALMLKEFRPYMNRTLDIPTVVYHGKADDVVPVEPVRRIAEKMFANLEYNVIEDNHPLETNFKLLDWNKLLCYE